ncbi:hypothetical protein V2J09_023444 [Rumex salicifolius]
MIMKGNPPMFGFDMNEDNQRVASDKLELRLGLPVKEDDPKTLVKPEIQGGKPFQAPINCGSFPISSSSADHTKFQHPSSSVKLTMQSSGMKGNCTPRVCNNSSVRTSLPNCSQKRTAPPPSVIGWPPVRSFRKKITANNNALKLSPDLATNSKEEEEEELKIAKTNDLFVKINMDGVPIGRKVNLKAHNDYNSLSSAVDHLFRGLLAAQKDATFTRESEITGLLDGNREYTLVYEDNEGDRVLVGDVPWNMFISTVKRLRVLKRSEISSE